MINSLLPPAQWAQNEFGFAQLNDKRRNKRLVKIGEKLAANPGGTLPQAFPEWADLKAAYRFFQRGVSFDQVLRPHFERTQTACGEPGEYLIIEDTTLLDFSNHPATQDLGYIGDGGGRGFELHSSLAFRVDGWNLDQRPEGTVIGLFGQQCTTPKPAPKKESRAARLSRPRKSQRWAQAFKTSGTPAAGSQWIYLADCESDFYEPMEICQQHGVDFIIRSFQQRRLADEPTTLWESLAQAPVLGQGTVEMRARPGQSARTAIVEMRARQMDLKGPWRPGGWKPSLKQITAVEVREINPPAQVEEPLHWLLLTSLPCTTLAQAQRTVGRYCARWWIEEYHKALKTGVGVETSQLERAYRLEALIGVLALVALRLLSAKMLARSRPESFEAVTSFGPEITKILEKKFGKPKAGWTNKHFLIAVARVGGFLARKNDGMPGWQTIWRGWQRISWMAEGLAILTGD